jgi:hypothetical protein
MMMAQLSSDLIMNYVCPFLQPCEILYVANSTEKFGDKLQQVVKEHDPYYLTETLIWDPYYTEGNKVQDVTLMSSENIFGTCHKVNIFFFVILNFMKSVKLYTLINFSEETFLDVLNKF